jgi:hypothetical protein
MARRTDPFDFDAPRAMDFEGGHGSPADDSYFGEGAPTAANAQPITWASSGHLTRPAGVLGARKRVDTLHADPDRVSDDEMTPGEARSSTNLQFMKQFGDKTYARFASRVRGEDKMSPATGSPVVKRRVALAQTVVATPEGQVPKAVGFAASPVVQSSPSSLAKALRGRPKTPGEALLARPHTLEASPIKEMSIVAESKEEPAVEQQPTEEATASAATPLIKRKKPTAVKKTPGVRAKSSGKDSEATTKTPGVRAKSSGKDSEATTKTPGVRAKSSGKDSEATKEVRGRSLSVRHHPSIPSAVVATKGGPSGKLAVAEASLRAQSRAEAAEARAKARMGGARSRSRSESSKTSDAPKTTARRVASSSLRRLAAPKAAPSSKPPPNALPPSKPRTARTTSTLFKPTASSRVRAKSAQPSTAEATAPSKDWKPTPTVPQSPHFSKVHTKAEPRLSSTSLELLKVKQRQEEERQKRKAQLKRVLHQAPSAPEHKAITVPETPTFAKPRAPRRAELQGEPAETPLAEKVAKAGALLRRASPVSKEPAHRHLTEPMEFHFATQDRISQRHLEEPKPLTSEERELQQIAEAKPFKARAVGEDVPVAVAAGPVPHRPLTEPLTPHFATDRRLEERKVHPKEEQEEDTFKARPMPVFSDPVVGVTRSAAPLTTPMSPVFQTKTRAARVTKTVPVEPPAPPPFRARKVGEGVPETLPAPVQHRPATAPHPFVLQSDRRGELSKAKLEAEQAAREQQEREARDFHAKPVGFGVSDAPARHAHTARGVTVPEPFHLRLDARAPHDKPEKSAVPAKAFKARPIPGGVLDGSRVFRPHHEKKVTRPMASTLSSDVRARLRAAYDEDRRKRSEEQHAEEEEKEAEARAQEEATLKEKRRTEMAFKARPFMGRVVPSRLFEQPVKEAEPEPAPTVRARSTGKTPARRLRSKPKTPARAVESEEEELSPAMSERKGATPRLSVLARRRSIQTRSKRVVAESPVKETAHTGI